MRPGFKRLVIGVLLFVSGTVVLPAVLVLPFVFGDRADEQFLVPGGIQVTASEPGRYYLWHDHRTIFQGKTYNNQPDVPAGMEITITDADSSEPLDFVPDGSMTVSSGTSASASVGYVELETPRTLNVIVSGPEGQDQRVFSFSKSIVLEVIAAVIGCFVGGGVLAVLGIVLVAWGAVKMVRSKPPEPRGVPLAGEY